MVLFQFVRLFNVADDSEIVGLLFFINHIKGNLVTLKILVTACKLLKKSTSRLWQVESELTLCDLEEVEILCINF